MCYVVIAGGPNKDLKPLLSCLSEAEKIICADSGADALVPFDIVPDVVWGDMDSISAETKEYLVNKQVPSRLFPIEKDMTDSELCLRSVPMDKKILFVTSLQGRPDHVVSNLLLTMRLHLEGYDITATDGKTWVFPLSGECVWSVPEGILSAGNTCSLIPLGSGAAGVSAKGMKYTLENKDLIPGSSFTVSNEFDMGKKEHGFEMKSGTMLVIVTPKV